VPQRPGDVSLQLKLGEQIGQRLPLAETLDRHSIQVDANQLVEQHHRISGPEPERYHWHARIYWQHAAVGSAIAPIARR
jgi:hypothetical protein